MSALNKFDSQRKRVIYDSGARDRPTIGAMVLIRASYHQALAHEALAIE